MKIIPAIDIMDGKCVRLLQGDFQRKNIYDDDISHTLLRFKNSGADFLHIIDLSAADNPFNSQKSFICQKINQAGLAFQIGGGIRSKEQIKQLLDNGAQRVIVGSLCVSQPQLVKTWLYEFGVEHLVLAFDYQPMGKDFVLATHGWKKVSSSRLFDTLSFFANKGLRVLATNIQKDGMLSSPDFELYSIVKQKFPNIILQASGGIASYDDIQKLEYIGLDEAIVGKALYENKINLEKVLHHD